MRFSVPVILSILSLDRHFGNYLEHTYLKKDSIPGQDLFRIYSEAHMSIRFLGRDKKISMKSVDTAKADLTLIKKAVQRRYCSSTT
jgi:hypothetical protein